MAARILIIEDDEAIAQMYRLKFEAEGYAVETARNGLLGLEAAQKIKPQVILLDLMMPEMNGDEMLAKLRATDWGKDIEAVVLTNISEQDIPQHLDKLGVAAVLQKAYHTPSQVVEIVKGILQAS